MYYGLFGGFLGLFIFIVFTFVFSPNNVAGGAFGLVSAVYALSFSIFCYLLLRDKAKTPKLLINSQSGEEALLPSAVTPNEGEKKDTSLEYTSSDRWLKQRAPVGLLLIGGVVSVIVWGGVTVFYLVYAGVNHVARGKSGMDLIATDWVTSVWTFMCFKWAVALTFSVAHHYSRLPKRKKRTFFSFCLSCLACFLINLVLPNPQSTLFDSDSL